MAFDGFVVSNYTQIPDVLFDELLSELNEGQLKVLLYVMRRTFGFGKSADLITLQQMTNGIQTNDGRVLDKGTGLARSTAVAAIKVLVEKGYLLVNRPAHGSREAPEFRLNIQSGPESGRDRSEIWT